MAFVLLTVTSNIMEGAYLGANATDTLWSGMTSFQAIDFSNPVTAVGGMVIAMANLMTSLFKMLVWDYSFLTGEWAIFKWLFMAISFGLVFSIITVLRGVSSS